MKITLASASPRRAKILASLGVDFETRPADCAETSIPDDPEGTVGRNALAKAACVPGRNVLAADTIVWMDGRIYGKPRDLDEARKFLGELSGRTHIVFTGVAFNGRLKVEKSRVTMRRLDPAAIEEYVSSVRPVDRAGAYDIDESGSMIVERYRGSYENIMGLPLEPLAEWGIIDSRPVGFFDSGWGGLSVLKEFWRTCPGEDTLYLADRKNCPYGNRGADEILRISRENTGILLERGAKAVVVACNTATAAAIETLRREYPSVPFIGVEPAVKPAVSDSKTGVVGVIATAGTLGGGHYSRTKGRYASGAKIVASVADGFVGIVESKDRDDILDGTVEWTASDRAAVREVIAPMLDAGCDTIVLGCTHFPHLAPLIEAECGERAKIVDPSRAVALQIARVIEKNGLSADLARPPVRMFMES